MNGARVTRSSRDSDCGRVPTSLCVRRTRTISVAHWPTWLIQLLHPAITLPRSAWPPTSVGTKHHRLSVLIQQAAGSVPILKRLLGIVIVELLGAASIDADPTGLRSNHHVFDFRGFRKG